MRAVAVGVDAGGTSTVAAASRDGVALGTSTGGAANVNAIGFDRAAAAIADVIKEALCGEKPDAICVGAAGAGRAEVADALTAALRARFPDARVVVCDDARIALRAAVLQGDGIVLVAGTGSIAYGEFGASVYRAGGYGYLLGDEGSGYSIGAASARLLMRTFDGRAPADPFTAKIAAALDARVANEVIERVYRSEHPVRTLAALARIALESANDGERSANKIVQSAAVDLGELIRSVVRSANAGNRDLPIVFAGGLLSGNSLLTYLLETRLMNDYPFMRVHKDASEPYVGALALAQGMLA